MWHLSVIAGLLERGLECLHRCHTREYYRCSHLLEFFSGLEAVHPVTVPFYMPVYSNPTFQILAYAMESMTNKSFVDVMHSALIEPLNLTSTYVTTPESTEGLNAFVVSGDEVQSGWKLPPGDSTSAA